MNRATTRAYTARALRAVSAGTFTAVLLTQFWLLWPRLSQFTHHDSTILVPTSMISFVGAGVVIAYAALCAMFLVPAWWILDRLHLATWMMAAMLGAAFAVGCLFTDSAIGRGVLSEDIAVAVIGALSGLTAWSAGRPKTIGI